MTTDHRDQPEVPEDEEYLWSGEGRADPEVVELERALGPLKSTRSFDPASLPVERSNVVRPARWRRAAWVTPLVAAAAVAAWFLSRPAHEDAAHRTAETSASATSDLPAEPSSKPAMSAPLASRPSCADGSTGPGLRFEVLEGAPARCGEADAPKEGTLPTGVWMTTPGGTRVRMMVAALGQVDIEPGSRVRVLATSEKEHRLELAHGKLHAVIDAPPRLFFVQTRSALAIDLGCEYTLAVDELGNGVLAVKTGFVELAVPAPAGQTSPISSLVPKGASAALIDGRGPGLPVWDREPEAVKAAARRVDANPSDAAAVDELLEGLGPRDTLTMIHLLPRVPREARERVLARLAAIEPITKDLRARAVLGEAAALQEVRAQFEPRWFPKPKLRSPP